MSRNQTAAALVVGLVVAVVGLVALVQSQQPGTPAHDPERWRQATFKAELSCSLDGYREYTDEYERCVDDRTQREYDELASTAS